MRSSLASESLLLGACLRILLMCASRKQWFSEAKLMVTREFEALPWSIVVLCQLCVAHSSHA
eukprot:5538789-Amphidinium_carterae.1